MNSGGWLLWVKQWRRVVGAAARNREPVLDFACCRPKQSHPALRQKKCNSDINQDQLRQEWLGHERMKLWLLRYHPKLNVVCLFPVYEIMKQVLHSLKF